MAEPAKVARDVQIRLTDLSTSPDNVELVERSIVLGPNNTSITIGRASKSSSKGCTAAKDNGWFNSQVMSRKHAEITVSSEDKVLIRDLSSLHGTFLNDEAVGVPTEEPRELKDGDRVKFGASVVRGVERYTPTTVKVGITFDHCAPPPSTTFRVPEDSDDGSDIDIDDSPSEHEESADLILEMPPRDPATLIDLTMPYPCAPSTAASRAYEVIDISSPVSSPSPIVIDDEDEPDSDVEHYEAWNVSGGQTTERISNVTLPPGFTLNGRSNFEGVVDDHDPDDEDGTSTRSMRFSTDEDLEESDVETSSSQSHESETRFFAGDDMYCDHESDGELDEESEYGYQLYSDLASDEELESQELAYESSDDDETRDPFWNTCAADVAPMESGEYPAPEPPTASRLSSFPELREKHSIPLKAAALTIGGLLNEDRPKAVHPSSMAIPKLLSPLLTNTAEASASSLPREPSPSDIIMSKISRNYITDTQTGEIEEGIVVNADMKITKCLATAEEIPSSGDRSPVATSGDMVGPAPDHIPDQILAAPLPSPFLCALPSLHAPGTLAALQAHRIWTPTGNSQCGSRRTHLGISDIVETCHRVDKVHGKRKADAITTLSEEEESWEASQPPREAAVEAPLSPLSACSPSPSPSPELVPVTEPTLGNSSPGPSLEPQVSSEYTAPEVVESSEEKVPAIAAQICPSEERAPKRLRLRHIAERVGYAALGGVTAGAMIFGTLVYTAPSFG